MNKKKKEAYLIIGIVGVICYLAFVLGYIHVVEVRLENPGFSTSRVLTVGINELMTMPLTIFPLPSGILGNLLVYTAIGGALTVIVVMNSLLKRHDNPDSAEWLSDLDAYNKKFTEPFGKKTHDGYNNMILSEEIYMSLNNSKIRRNMNVFCIGGSGAGKSYNLVGPNIMQANTSYIITDPSGGLFKEYGKFLEYLGYRVKCFNLDHMDRGNHYNPFQYITSDKDIEILVTTLISNTTPPDSKGGDSFWEKSETALLVSLIAYLFHYADKEQQNFSSVMKLLRAADIDENDSSQKSPLDRIFEQVEKTDPEGFAINQYKTFKMGAGKTLKGILISCAVRLQAFDLADVIKLTNTDDIDLESVGDEKTALFVIIPTADKTFNFLASMMYSQLFQQMFSYCENTSEFSQLVMDGDMQLVRTFRAMDEKDSQRAKKEAEEFFERAKNATVRYNDNYSWYELITDKEEIVTYRGTKKLAEDALSLIGKGKVMCNSEQSNHGQRLPIHTRFLLDEFANTGKIPAFPERVSTIRKYDISCMIVLQSITQLKNMYKDDWSNISGNCDNTIYLGGGADTETAEWVSKLLGKKNVVLMNQSYQGNGGGSMSLNNQKTELLEPAQLRTLPEDECIVIPKSLWAYKGLKFKSDNHKNRPLVKSLPSYVFDAKKNEELTKQKRLVDSGTSIPVREVEERPEEDVKQIDRENKAREQVAKEYSRNADCNGEEIISDPKDMKKSNFVEDFDFNNKDEIKEYVDSVIEINEGAWGIEEMVFNSAPTTK